MTAHTPGPWRNFWKYRLADGHNLEKGECEEALLITRLRKEAKWQTDVYGGAPCSEILRAAADTIERLLSSSKTLDTRSPVELKEDQR
ncbi:MAG: hypothetical protein ACOVKO_01860 [Elstera sp.]|jgi:hypothetical protein